MNKQKIEFGNKNLLFQPWVGSQYGVHSLFKIPILIIGESNYTDNLEREKPHDTFTHRLIESIINGSWKHNFFSNIQRTFVESANTQELRSEFWHSVAHHEYIQDWLPRPGIAPSREMWAKAKPMFQEVVAELKPKCVLFVCKRVHAQVSPHFPRSTPLNVDGSYPPTLTAYGNSHPTLQIDDALASWIYHPSLIVAVSEEQEELLVPLLNPLVVFLVFSLYLTALQLQNSNGSIIHHRSISPLLS